MPRKPTSLFVTSVGMGNGSMRSTSLSDGEVNSPMPMPTAPMSERLLRSTRQFLQLWPMSRPLPPRCVNELLVRLQASANSKLIPHRD
jgi:hypothetical protein